MLRTSTQLHEDIKAGKRLLIAAEENILQSLPQGNWIAGTIPYFMAESGGVCTREQAFVTELPEAVEKIILKSYDPQKLSSIPADAPENGFSFIIIPATSEAHISYAQNAPDYEGIFRKNIIGWISGVHLDDLGKKSPKVFSGTGNEGFSDRAVVMHCTVKQGITPSIGIINLFKPGNGPEICFSSTGFSITDCQIDGKTENFAQYLTRSKTDIRLPLVADYSGAMVNVSFQNVDQESGTVSLYAPVFSGVTYRIAEPVQDYVKEFTQALPTGITSVFSCNCILNYLYSDLDGKKTDGMAGPVTFGEIAYQLLNQTLVYLTLE